jgi:hypothetical protein
VRPNEVNSGSLTHRLTPVLHIRGATEGRPLPRRSFMHISSGAFVIRPDDNSVITRSFAFHDVPS